ncbi:MAG: ESCRT-III subunit protein snf7 [Icmadophila ericetorum]|nr:ESCRT-III subunit protein snf7 [Icmadophila ericetorum]
MWGASWFGGSGAQKRKDAPKKAILDLRQQLDMLQKREKHLENQMAEQEAIARKNVATNKTGMPTSNEPILQAQARPRGHILQVRQAQIEPARTALKRKKAHEHSLEQTSAQISMLENQIYSIESANINQETLLAMKNASQAMKNIHGGLTIDKVDQIMEELGDQKALADEIGNAIANGPAAGEPIDEDELAEDLARLEQEDLDEKMLTTGTVPMLPTGPNGDLIKGKTKAQPAEEEDEEEELRKLQAEMAM